MNTNEGLRQQKTCRHTNRHAILIMLLAIATVMTGAKAEILCDSTEVWFRQSHMEVDTALFDNGRNLDRMLEWIRTISKEGSLYRLRTIRVAGAASPEGSYEFNRQLSHHRADNIFRYFTDRVELPDSLTSFDYIGRDWTGLASLVENDMAVPSRAEVMAIIADAIKAGNNNRRAENLALARLKQVGGGAPYRYLYANLFPKLRFSRLYTEYEALPQPILVPDPEVMITVDSITGFIETPDVPADIPMELGVVKVCKPFYMGLKTNLLFDALALPSLGAEFYVGRKWSVVGNWFYGWWDNDNRHRYWRAYGGDIALRRWFGQKAHRKPLTGHHLGVYAGVVTYDFEFGGTGYMGGNPGRTLWDRCNYYAGVEYGFSLPVARRLNIDFTIGLGYLGGKYQKYEPCPYGNGYVWQSTHRLHWFGPTKAEISLVWLIGCDNYNRR